MGLTESQDGGTMESQPNRNQEDTMAATIRKQGSADYGYWVIQCEAPECRDLNGRPWQLLHSRRTVEGRRLANRDRDNHNASRHPAT